MAFLTVWLLFVYFPFVHMVWGGGLLAQVGRARLRRRHRRPQHRRHGGARLGALRRPAARSEDRGPHSIPLVALGTGLLWFGWYGFNAGSEFRVDSVTAVAFLNTDVAASFAAIAWLVVAWIFEKRPSFLGLLTGRGRRPRDDHAGRRLRLAGGRGPHRRRSPGVVCYGAVALKNRLQLGRRARRLGRPRRRRLPRRRPARRVRHDGLQPAGRERPARRQPGVPGQAARGRASSRRSGRSRSPTACSG